MTLHIVNPFANAFGGSERGALELWRGVAGKCETILWSEDAPDPRLGETPIRRIDLKRGEHPRGGTLLLHGNFFLPGPWLESSGPRCTLLGYNTVVRPDLKYAMIERLQRLGPFEIVYASRLVRDWVGVPGVVLPSRIDLARFVPRKRAADDDFIVGRLSRDELPKHHPEDPAIYRALAARGARVRIMGGTCLGEAHNDLAGVELLPAGAMDATQFLQGLDCFYYRTSPNWSEAGGRVVAEAMACGLPVVCHAIGGYAEWIEHGRSGYLFESDDEALRLIDSLRQDPGLRQSVGRAAREAMVAMYSPEAARAYFEFFVR
ncbi:MAG: glycosyltransferase family 4 protein [Burkholderiales bacterium]